MKFLKKILLVDHEPRMTALVRQALENTGCYLVKVEQDIRLALHAAPWFLPDLIMLDAAGAEAEGEDVNHQLQSEPALKDTPFLFLSSTSGLDQKVLTGGFLGGYRFVANAVSLEDLLRCVHEMLNPASIPTSPRRRHRSAR
jgi:two-component system cell cycle response regulator